MKSTTYDCGVSNMKSANYTKMLMQAQDQRNLVNKVITMRHTLINDQPKRYRHLDRNFGIVKNEK
jgi:hypothetical protein